MYIYVYIYIYIYIYVPRAATSTSSARRAAARASVSSIGEVALAVAGGCTGMGTELDEEGGSSSSGSMWADTFACTCTSSARASLPTLAPTFAFAFAIVFVFALALAFAFAFALELTVTPAANHWSDPSLKSTLLRVGDLAVGKDTVGQKLKTLGGVPVRCVCFMCTRVVGVG